MKEMKECSIEWIGKIPSNWKVLRNKYNFTLEKRIVGANCDKTQLLSLTKYGVKQISPEEHTGKVPTTYATYQLVEKTDLIMCLFDLDVSAVFSGLSHFNGMISPAYKNFKCKQHLIPEYADYYYRTVFIDRKYMRYSKNVRFTLTSDDFLNLSMIIPPLDEQRKIVNYLNKKCNTIDLLIKKIESEIESLEKFKMSLINENVKAGEQIRFKYIAKICSNLVNPSLYQNYKQIAPDSIEKNSGKILTERTVKEIDIDSWNHLFFKGQLLYSKIRPVLNKVTIAPYDGLCSADMYPIEAKGNIRFLKYLMLSPYFVEQVDLITRDRIKMPKINQDELGNIRVFMPSIEKQNEIADYLDSKCSNIEQIINSKKEQLKLLTNYKNTTIFEYITGKKEVA